MLFDSRKLRTFPFPGHHLEEYSSHLSKASLPLHSRDRRRAINGLARIIIRLNICTRATQDGVRTKERGPSKLGPLVCCVLLFPATADYCRRLGGYFDSTNCNTPAGYLEAQKEPGSRHHSGHRLLGTSAVSYRNRRRHLNTRFAGISGFHDRKGSAWGRSYSHEWQNSAVHQR